MKLTIQILFALVVTQFVAAQDLKIGVCVSPQITWLKPESRSVDIESAAIGISGGLNFDAYFRKNYAFNFGLQLGSQAGSLRFSDESVIETEDGNDTLNAGAIVDYRFNSIIIPVGIKLKTNEIGYFSYFAQIGFTNQFRLKAKASSGSDLDKAMITKEIKPFNMSYHFGAGVEYALSEDTSITAGIYFNNGFFDLTKHSPKVYIRSLSLNLGVIF